jgi:hypothetical protein
MRRFKRLSLLLSVLMAAEGCIVVPHITRQELLVSRRLGTLRQDGPGVNQLSARTSGRSIEINAQRRQMCVQDQTDLLDIVTDSEARIETADGKIDCGGSGPLCPLVLGGMVIFAGVIFIASGIVSGIVVGVTGNGTKRVQRFTPAVPKDCSQSLSGVAVQIAFEDQPTLEGITDAEGRVRFEISAGAPEQGTARVSGPASLAFAYDASRSSFADAPLVVTPGGRCERVPQMHAWRCPGTLVCRDMRCVVDAAARD